MKTFKTPNGLEVPMQLISGKPYMPVQSRILWCRADHPDWLFEVTFLEATKDRTVAKATIKDGAGKVIAQAHKVEDTAGFKDHLEKAESSAIGRALAHIGYGTQFAVELDEGQRLADSPSETKREVKQSVVEPARPTHNSDLGNYVITFGKKYKDRRLNSLTWDELESFVTWLEERSDISGKPLTGPVLEFVETAKQYLSESIPVPLPSNPAEYGNHVDDEKIPF